MIILNIILWVKEWSIFKFAKINMAKKYLIMIKQVSTTLLMDRTDPAKDVKVESASRKTFKQSSLWPAWSSWSITASSTLQL